MARKKQKPCPTQATKSAILSAAAGDRVRLSCDGGDYEGILLPHTGKEGFLTLKLASGYNIGIRQSRVQSIQILKKGEVSLKTGPKAPQEQSPAPPPFISLLSCGGTIVNRIDYKTGAVSPASTPEELLAGLPWASKYRLSAKLLFSLASEDMAPAHWQILAKEAFAQIKDGAEGVVIAHGTDTMHYTSAALSFMLQNLPCPVILTGSQRSSDRGSSDAQTNLHASFIAAKADVSGVFICMHHDLSDESCALFYGTKVRKMHTTRRDAFRSINVLPAAKIQIALEKVEKSQDCPSRNPQSQPRLEDKLNTNVAMQYVYPGIKPQAISALSKYDGVVLVGMGLGHVPVNLCGDKLSTPILQEVKSLISSGVAVVFASQCIYGRAAMDVYTNSRALKDAGVIGNLCDMTPETAYVKLMWVLGREKKPQKVKQLMETNLVGEISSRTEIVPF
ncbi:MAG: Glu-tRNA(Gln) amidotransferase subunit GatD [Candidatus Micrarchaeota archaeon]|nr:Glu-tRNA(Gln) amidotransferase subunit GatD [Candidatus Micrarchaeota archaeon]